jgi:hypothetical protein
MASEENSIEREGRFDPAFCRKVCWAAAIACLALTLCTVAILAAFSPSQCAGWMIQQREGGSYPVWPFVAIAGLWSVVLSYHAVNWQRAAQRIAEHLRWGEQTFPTGHDHFRAMCAALIDFNVLFVMIAIGSVAMVAMPLLIMALNCY